MKNTNPIKETKEEKKKFFTKGYLIGLAISFASVILTSGIIFLIRYYGGMLGEDDRLIISFADAFGISGALGILFFLIVWASNYGAFDAISYSVQLAWVNIFHHKERQTRLPKTYHDYRLLKRGRERVNTTFLLIPGAIFLIAGIVSIIIYNVR